MLSTLTPFDTLATQVDSARCVGHVQTLRDHLAPYRRVPAVTLAKRLVDVRPLLTATLPLERAVEAFELASDRSRAMKVQLAFT